MNIMLTQTPAAQSRSQATGRTAQVVPPPAAERSGPPGAGAAAGQAVSVTTCLQSKTAPPGCTPLAAPEFLACIGCTACRCGLRAWSVVSTSRAMETWTRRPLRWLQRWKYVRQASCRVDILTIHMQLLTTCSLHAVVERMGQGAPSRAKTKPRLQRTHVPSVRHDSQSGVAHVALICPCWRQKLCQPNSENATSPALPLFRKHSPPNCTHARRSEARRQCPGCT